MSGKSQVAPPRPVRGTAGSTLSCQSTVSPAPGRTSPNEVWAIDITYVPMARGFVYRVAVVDWFSGRALAWRLSMTMDLGFCIEAVEEGVARYGYPEIFNSDQGSQFTSIAFTKILKDRNIEISMDGRGAWKDNVFVEQLRRSIKYDEICLRAYASVPDARAGIGRYLSFYNKVRPHSSLGYLTPAEFVASSRSAIAAPANATGRDAAVCGAFAPRPVAQPLRKGQIDGAVMVAHAK